VDIDATKTWEIVLDIIKAKVSKPSFETWLQATEAMIVNNNFIITTPDEFTRDWLINKYRNLIKEALEQITGNEYQLLFLLPSENENIINETNFNENINNIIENKNLNETSARLNPKYTFDTFVIGANNRFAHAAALAVAELPAKSYNPLFIYGGVGLGKTHLMHAIGHYVLQNNPQTKIAYISTEKFTNEFINSIIENQTLEFRNKYRNIDVLLIDDIQFLVGKEQTQEEFFHTFNALHEANKQIVISSDRPPKDIPTLEDRLRSRFEWGLLTDIQPPDLETRMAILKKKARAEQLQISEEVINYIANQVHSNIRELEGALIRVVAYSSLVNRDMNIELAQLALKDIISPTGQKKLTIYDIQQIVARHYNLKVEDLTAKKRTKELSYPRQIAMYLARELTDQSLPKIGEEFGGRDHTTVMHAYEKITAELKINHQLEKTIANLKEKIKLMNNKK